MTLMRRYLSEHVPSSFGTHPSGKAGATLVKELVELHKWSLPSTATERNEMNSRAEITVDNLSSLLDDFRRSEEIQKQQQIDSALPSIENCVPVSNTDDDNEIIESTSSSSTIDRQQRAIAGASLVATSPPDLLSEHNEDMKWQDGDSSTTAAWLSPILEAFYRVITHHDTTSQRKRIDEIAKLHGQLKLYKAELESATVRAATPAGLTNNSIKSSIGKPTGHLERRRQQQAASALSTKKTKASAASRAPIMTTNKKEDKSIPIVSAEDGTIVTRGDVALLSTDPFQILKHLASTEAQDLLVTAIDARTEQELHSRRQESEARLNQAEQQSKILDTRWHTALDIIHKSRSDIDRPSISPLISAKYVAALKQKIMSTKVQQDQQRSRARRTSLP